jgi:hypothetical protein
MRRWVAVGVVALVCELAGCGSSTQGGAPGKAQAGSSAAGTSTTESGGGNGSAGAVSSAGASTAPPVELQDLCPVFTRDLCAYLMQCEGARYQDAAHCERELDCFGKARAIRTPRTASAS